MKKRVVILLSVIIVALIIAVGVIYKNNNKPVAKEIDYESATSKLINENATEEAKELMEYLKSIYGKKVLTGQYVNEYDDFSLPRQDSWTTCNSQYNGEKWGILWVEEHSETTK